MFLVWAGFGDEAELKMNEKTTWSEFESENAGKRQVYLILKILGRERDIGIVISKFLARSSKADTKFMLETEDLKLGNELCLYFRLRSLPDFRVCLSSLL